jgi:hypothetical protein
MAFGNNPTSNPVEEFPQDSAFEITPGQGRDKPPTFRQFGVGVIAGIVLGYIIGRTAPLDWPPAIRIPLGKGGVMESILGGVIITITPQPTTTVTKTTPEGGTVTVDSHTVTFDLSDSDLAATGENLYIGIGWPTSEGWPIDLGPSTDAYLGSMTYEWGIGTAKRIFKVTHDGVTLEHEFSTPPDGNLPAVINDTLRDVNEALGTGTLVIRYKGYRDLIPLKVAVPQ